MISTMNLKRATLAALIVSSIGLTTRESYAVGPYTWDGGGSTSNLLENLNWSDDVGPEDRRVRAGYNGTTEDPLNSIYANNDSSVIFAGTTRLDPYIPAAGWASDDANPPTVNPDASSVVGYNNITFNNTAGPFVISLGPDNTTGLLVMGPTSATTALRTIRNDSVNTQTFNLGIRGSWVDINAAAGNIVINGSYSLASASSSRRHIVLGNFDVYFNGGISGEGVDALSGFIQLDGPGRTFVTASSASTAASSLGGLWNGRFRIGDGILRVSHNAALGAGNAEGATSGRTTIGILSNDTGAVELVNNITTSERFFVTGRSNITDSAVPHIVNVSGSNTLTGPIYSQVIAGSRNTVIAANDDGLDTAELLTIQGNIEQQVAGTIANPNFLTLTGNGAGVISGSIINGITPATMTWSVQKSGTGTWTLSGVGNNYAGSTAVNNGTLDVATGSSIDTSTSINVKAGATLIADHVRPATSLTVDGTVSLRSNGGVAGASKAETLTITGAGKLDLKDNDLVVGTAANVTIVRDAIKLGKTNNAPSGITSDAALFVSKTGFGYAMGDDPNLSPLLTNSSLLTGQSFDADSVLVKYTFLGDADLDGDTDLNDLGKWASNFTGDLNNPAVPAKFWTQGDFDYDGDTDLNDLGKWSSNFTGDLNGGAGSLIVYAPGASASAVAVLNGMGITVVPEPSTFVLAGVGLAGLAIAARRKKLCVV